MPIELHRLGNTSQDRNFRNNMNENWDKLEYGHNKIEQISEQAKEESTTAKEQAKEANDLSKNIQKQLDALVLDGDSSVEAAQARVDTYGNAHPNLKARTDSDFQKNATLIEFLSEDVIAHKNELDVLKQSVGVSIENFPRIGAESSDTPRVQRAYDALGSNGGRILFPDGTFIFNLEIIKSNVKLTGLGRNVTIFKPADLTKPLIKIGNADADVRYVSVEKVKLLGGETAPPSNSPYSDGIVIDGALYTSLSEIELTYFGGDNLRITSTSAKRSTSYVFINDFISQWARRSSVYVDNGSAWVTGVYINNFSVQGYTNLEARAIYVKNTRVYLSNGWVTCKNGVGHVFIDNTGSIFCNNVAIDSNSSSDTVIETTLNNTTSGRKLGTFIAGTFSVNGKWKRGDGVVSSFTIQGATTLAPNSRLTSAHVVDRLYFSDINSNEPDNINNARQFYRDGTRIRTFFDDVHANGLYLSMFVPTPPSSSNSVGHQGYFSSDANYLYVCVDYNKWIRIAKAQWDF